MKTITLFSVLALPLAATAWASSPTAVKIRPTRIEFEPNASAPERIVIHGAASLWSQQAACTFGVMPGHPRPTCGVYLYYQCPADNLKMCRVQWTDIQMALAQQMTASFGDPAKPPRLRREGEPLAMPDEYTLGYGVMRGESLFCTKPEDWNCSGLTVDAGASHSADAAVSMDAAAPVDNVPAVDAGAPTEPTPAASVPMNTPASAEKPAKPASRACAYGGGGHPGPLALLALLFAGRRVRRAGVRRPG